MSDYRGHQEKTSAGAVSGDRSSCSFCGKHERQIKTLIAGPSKHICNECIDRVRAVMAATSQTASTRIATIQQVDDADRAKRCSFCGKQRRHVAAMASTRRAKICSECVELCEELISEGPNYYLGQDHGGPEPDHNRS